MSYGIPRSQIHQEMDACRPDGNDLADPSMKTLKQWIEENPANRQVFERVQEFDFQMMEAYQDVEVPADLAERIKRAILGQPESQTDDSTQPELAAPHVSTSATENPEPVLNPTGLSTSEAGASVETNDRRAPTGLESAIESAIAHVQDAEGHQVQTADLPRAAKPTPTQSRRFPIVVAFAAVAVLVLVGIFVSGLLEPAPSASLEDLCRAAPHWSDLMDEAQWNSSMDQAPQNRPWYTELNQLPDRWGRIELPLDRSAVVYDLGSQGSAVRAAAQVDFESDGVAAVRAVLFDGAILGIGV